MDGAASKANETRMKATLIDVHTVSREVELPDKCPSCQCDLTEGLETIKVFELQSQKRWGALDSASGHFELCEESDCKGAEYFVSYTDYWCALCDSPLLESLQTESDVGELPPGAEHARYTLELWWEALRENPKLRCSYEAWVAGCLVADNVQMSASPPTLPEGLPPAD
jgi:hypothetical protein